MILVLFLFLLHPVEPEDVRIMFWNVENFFDFKDDGMGESDHEFSPEGARHWTRSRFYRKCETIAKTIFLAADDMDGLPDVIGLAEVENRYVLSRLVWNTQLRKCGYEIIHYDSFDRRGIDCAILYRKGRFERVVSKACHIHDGDSLVRTRDILVAGFVKRDGRNLAVLVNHHPSKLGGKNGQRDAAMKRMHGIADSLRLSGYDEIISIGDFNDSLEAFSCTEKTGSAEGTIKFNGRWEKIDGCALLWGLAATERILDAPHLTTEDRSWTGTKPLRTYNGPRWLGGVSDHYPVLFKLRSKR